MGVPTTGADAGEETRSQIDEVWSSSSRVVAVTCGTTWYTHALPLGGSVVLGRSPECDLRVDLPSISRAHLEIHSIGSSVEIEDLGSRNGTFMGGQRLPRGCRTRLPSGAVVEIGCALVVVLGDDRAADLSATLPGDAGARARVVVPSAMNRVQQIVDLVAPGALSVVLLGETGVGKERMAITIHARSSRARGPMVAINCAAIPESLLESELFGYERGAFSGAAQAKPGVVEAADGGTLFLDEVAELPLSAQAKLLRALETRQVWRLGAASPRSVDVRFVAATNRDLAALVETGAFRRDVYHRLNGITIVIPPLRERVEEIPELVRVFVEQVCAGLGRPPASLTDAAVDDLRRRPWPGNVRELRNTIERAVLLANGERIYPEHLYPTAPSGSTASAVAPNNAPVEAPTAESGVTIRGELAALERRRILEALERTVGNQTQAAKLLGMSRRTLVGRLDAYGLPRPRRSKT